MPSLFAAFARPRRALNKVSRDSGQSLIETALAVPFLLLIALNAINFAYYFFVAINLAAAPRNAVEYSVQGFATPAQLQIPLPDDGKGNACSSQFRGSPDLSVSSLAYYDVISVLPSAATPACPQIAAVQVCNRQNGLNNKGTPSQASNCTSYGPAASPAFGAAAADPEAPNFVLDRVDIQYTVVPLIGGTLPVFGGIRLSVLPSYTFHRQVSMREMN